MACFRLLVCFAVLLHSSLAHNPCSSRVRSSGLVCVCNSTYCDTVPEVRSLKSREYQLFSTSKNAMGFSTTSGNFSDNFIESRYSINISDLTKTHQKILGFGGAFTDSTGINILSLPEAAQNHLLESYFGKDGIQYSIGRIPIGGTDYSVRAYTYCDEKDETLGKFALQQEDYKYKIPMVKKAANIRGEDLILFASSWSAPTWMKTNNEIAGKGRLKDEYYALWATYYLKFFASYNTENITFWGVTTQNEPYYGLSGESFNSLGFTAEEMNKWVSQHLGPRIRASNFSHLKIILHDDFRANLEGLIKDTLSNSEVVKYADGVGLHWYTDFQTPEDILDQVKSPQKDLFLLATEACILRPDESGNWTNAELYVESIMVDLNHNFIGWVDWNMVLNLQSGPSWVNNQYDSPVIVNASAQEFYKNPTFYAMGHFSKFVVPGSLRVESTSDLEDNVKQIAFLRPDGKLAVVVMNSGDQEMSVTLNILGVTKTVTLQSHSLNTVLYQP